VLKYFDEVRTAGERVFYLRTADLHTFLQKNGNWKAAFDVDPVWDTDKPDDPKKHKDINAWPVMNRDKTIDAIKDKKKVTVAEATKIYDDKWAQIIKGEGYQGHKSAIDRAEILKNGVRSIDITYR
jgi:hypothetical protein